MSKKKVVVSYTVTVDGILDTKSKVISLAPVVIDVDLDDRCYHPVTGEEFPFLGVEGSLKIKVEKSNSLHKPAMANIANALDEFEKEV